MEGRWREKDKVVEREELERGRENGKEKEGGCKGKQDKGFVCVCSQHEKEAFVLKIASL